MQGGCSSRVDLTSIVVTPIGAIHGVETNNFWILIESLFKSNCLLQILSHALALEFLSASYIVTNKQNRTTSGKLQPSQPLPTTLHIVVGQVRVVDMVVVGIYASYPSLSLECGTKESKLQPSTTRTIC